MDMNFGLQSGSWLCEECWLILLLGTLKHWIINQNTRLYSPMTVNKKLRRPLTPHYQSITISHPLE